MDIVEKTPAGEFIEGSKDPAEWQRQLYASKSMIETASTQTAPVAIFQGQADHATPEYEAVALRDTLVAEKRPPYFFKIYPSLSHGLAKGAGRNGHCEKFGPVDPNLLGDIVSSVKNRL